MNRPPALLFDRVLPARGLTPAEGLQLRILAGAAALGLAIALVSIVANAVLSKNAGLQLLAPFALGCIALVAGIRKGVSLPVLRRAATLLVGAFLFGMCLLTTKMDWAQLKWFVLLPVMSLLLSGASDDTGPRVSPMRSVGGSTLLAIALAVGVIVARWQHWNAEYPLVEVSARSYAIGQLIDHALFMVSIAGLLSIHHLALRRSEEEARMLRSILAMCAWCRRIREDDEGWVAIEDYMTRHKATDLTHGICPECSARVAEEMARS